MIEVTIKALIDPNEMEVPEGMTMKEVIEILVKDNMRDSVDKIPAKTSIISVKHID